MAGRVLLSEEVGTHCVPARCARPDGNTPAAADGSTTLGEVGRRDRGRLSVHCGTPRRFTPVRVGRRPRATIESGVQPNPIESPQKSGTLRAFARPIGTEFRRRGGDHQCGEGAPPSVLFSWSWSWCWSCSETVLSSQEIRARTQKQECSTSCLLGPVSGERLTSVNRGSCAER